MRTGIGFDSGLSQEYHQFQQIGPAVLSTPRAVAPPAGTGDAVALYYSQTRFRQEAGLFVLNGYRTTGG